MLNAFLLTRQWRDTRDGITLDFWWATEQGPCWTQATQQEVVFFALREDAKKIAQRLQNINGWRVAEVDLKTFRNQSVNALYFSNQRNARDVQSALAQIGVTLWEADIRPHERYLMERFITAGAIIHQAVPGAVDPLLNPKLTASDIRVPLKMVSLDIETSMDAKQLFSIAVWAQQDRKIFMVGADQESTSVPIIFCQNQKECLQKFLNWMEGYDPDILIGWSLVQFDLWVLENLCQAQGITFTLGRNNQRIHWRHEDDEGGRRFVIIPGRVALDGIDLLKAANFRFESYSLQFVAGELLGKSKLLHGKDRGKDITRLFSENKIALAEYNLRDCELVWDIFEDKKLLHFSVERSQLTGLLMDRAGGSVAAFEYSYLPRLHRKGYVAPNLGELESDVSSPGGYVMDSMPGIYNNILVLDFKSLYPSIIRTFLIDPYAFWVAEHEQLPAEQTLVGFNGACFSRENHILPGMIEHLWAARDIAKREHNAPLSHAIKIIMNSFYGVLGSTGCRFFDPRVCSSITLRGHDIIQRSRQWIELQGYKVIYGDTDSLFVWVENKSSEHPPKTQAECKKVGEHLATELNDWWQATITREHAVKSHLEIQFETHYLQFLMPTIRGSELGTKKRYAGVIDNKGIRGLVFKGLENVRTDWTRLAKNFQETLYRKVFAGEDYLDFVREIVADVLDGKRDDDLVYNKRLRRHLHQYEKNVPPHVQAARKYVERTGKLLRRGDWIAYVMTTQGAEPSEAQQSPLDYQHYVDKQLTPIADSILHFLDQNMASLVDNQLSLFAD